MQIKDKRNTYTCTCQTTGLMTCVYHVILACTGLTPDETMDPIIALIEQDLKDESKKS